MKSETITYRDIEELLSRLGFTTEKKKLDRTPSKVPVVLYDHPSSGARFMFPDKPPQEPARPLDLETLKAHLDYRGHLDKTQFDEFLQSKKLPAAM